MKKRMLFVLLILFLTVSILSAKIINVPSDYENIQDAINISTDGDTVLLAPGTYTQRFYMAGKKITLASLFLITNDRSYIDSTELVYGQNSQSIIRCIGYEDSSTIITGFTIGSESLGCNGIECENSSPSILDNIFKTSDDYGIKCRRNSNPIISRNAFLLKYPQSAYNCIDIIDSKSQIVNNLFFGKNGTNSSAIKTDDLDHVYISSNTIKNFYFGIQAGGSKTLILNNLIYNCDTGILSEYESPLLMNNTIIYNTKYGVRSINGIPEILNCIFWGNAKDFSGIISISNSNVWGCLPYQAIDNGGNIFKDPKFVNVSNENFRLSGDSPNIDAGYSNEKDYPISEYDIDFNKRLQDGNGDSTVVIDIGCYEKEKAINPAYVSGNITLTGGSGKVEEVEVGIGTMVHPDESGNYILAITAPDSSYSVFASLDTYLMKEIKYVNIEAGEITPNINFNLKYYNPEKILQIKPDTLKFLTEDDIAGKKVYFKNTSLVNTYIKWIGSNSDMFYFDEDSFSIPHYISPGDSCDLIISLPLILGSPSSNLTTDSLSVFFNTDSTVIPIIYDPSLIVSLNGDELVSDEFRLDKNYPNPFNTNTRINFSVSIKDKIELEVYNILGQKVRTLLKRYFSKGEYSVIWDGTDDNSNLLSSGLYLYVLKDQKHRQVKKMLMLK